MCECGTIREIHKRLVSEGYHISEYALRLWIKQGILPYVLVGNKALIHYSNVINILQHPQCATAQNS